MPELAGTGGIRIFQGASKEALEDAINTFLAGTGVAEDPRKSITQAPAFTISGGVFYALIVYQVLI